MNSEGNEQRKKKDKATEERSLDHKPKIASRCLSLRKVTIEMVCVTQRPVRSGGIILLQYFSSI